MHDDRDTPVEERRSPVERILRRDRDDARDRHRRLDRRTVQTQRSLEAYLKAGNRPRWMERLGEIEHGVSSERRRVERAYRALQRECGDDRALFERRWREAVAALRFDRVNELIRQHNEWFPIERQLPMDPRTRDYVLIHGRSYRHRELDADWVLEQFPAAGGRAS